jgi:hypothetical protein
MSKKFVPPLAKNNVQAGQAATFGGQQGQKKGDETERYPVRVSLLGIGQQAGHDNRG